MADGEEGSVVSIEHRLQAKGRAKAPSQARLRLLVARAMNAPASLSAPEISEIASHLLVFIDGDGQKRT